MFCLHVYIYTTTVHYISMSAEGVEPPGTGVMDGCELPCGYQGLNLAPLLVLITTEPARLPLICLAFEVVFS